jgi:hypothetical protein
MESIISFICPGISLLSQDEAAEHFIAGENIG